MEALKKLLFGRKVYFEDSILGTFETRVKSENPSIEKTWYGGNQIAEQKGETTFIIEGNSNGPNKSDLEAVKRILTELPRIINEIDSELSKKSNYPKVADWINTFFLSAITPYQNGFEVNFESTNSDDTRMVSCLWTNGRIEEVEGN